MALDIFQRIYDDSKPQWCYRLGVNLIESPVKVYREVEVPSNIRLSHLAELLIRTIGWVGYHLYDFRNGDDLYTSREEIREFKRWQGTEPRFKSETKYHDYTCYTLGQVLRQKGDSLLFRYDFGDNWQHDVFLLEKKKYTERQDPDFYVVVGEGGCPPDDVGGVGGYAYMLQLFEQPDKDPDELDNYLQWLPEDYDPHRFDLHATELRIIDYLRVVRTFTER